METQFEVAAELLRMSASQTDLAFNARRVARAFGWVLSEHLSFEEEAEDMEEGELSALMHLAESLWWMLGEEELTTVFSTL